MQKLNVGQARYAIRPALVMVAALGSTAVGQAQIAQPGARDTRLPALPKPAIVAPSERLRLALVGVPTVHLRPVDVDALLAEDAAQAHPHFLENVSDATPESVRLDVGGILAIQQDGSRARFDQAVHHLEGGGFARAGSAQ